MLLARPDSRSAVINAAPRWSLSSAVAPEPAASNAIRPAIENTLDDDAARMAELIGKLAQAQLLAADPQAIELHELRLVELGRDPRPQGIDIVRRAARRQGH